jgi:hypothetical protein
VECEYPVTLVVDSGLIEIHVIDVASGPSMASMPFIISDGVVE